MVKIVDIADTVTRYAVDGSKGATYTVRQYTPAIMGVNEWQCTCPHFQIRLEKTSLFAECKHIKGVKEWLDAQFLARGI